MTEKKTEGWIDDLVGALCDPVIVYPSGWEDTLPDWIFTQVKLERLVMNMKVIHEGGVPVGDTEVMAYIYPRTMEAPLSEQWTRIYMYCFNQAMKFKKTEVPDDLQQETLSDGDMQQLKELKSWVYERRVKARKDRARQQKQEETRELTTEPVQSSFF